MNHVTDEIADYLENRLPPERRREVTMHLDGCGECASAVAFAMRLREEALAQGVIHIRPDRIVALSTPTETATDGERRHLAACESCRNELEWAKTQPDEKAVASADSSDRKEPRRRRPSLKLWLSGAAGVAAAVVALVLFLPRGSDDTRDIAALARIEPLPVRISRSVAEPGSFEAARLRGLELYRDGDYAAAVAALGEALTLKPGDAEMLVYLGSSELLQGDVERATRHLEEGLSGVEAAPLREELLWQLANARLRAGNVAAAKQTLTEVIELDRTHAAEARQLLETIER